LSDQSAPPSKKGKSNILFICLDDDLDNGNEGRWSTTSGTIKGRPDTRKKGKGCVNKKVVLRDGSMREKIDELMKERKEMATESLQMKIELNE
jgi:hypothetical protein